MGSWSPANILVGTCLYCFTCCFSSVRYWPDGVEPTGPIGQPATGMAAANRSWSAFKNSQHALPPYEKPVRYTRLLSMFMFLSSIKVCTSLRVACVYHPFSFTAGQSGWYGVGAPIFPFGKYGAGTVSIGGICVTRLKHSNSRLW